MTAQELMKQAQTAIAEEVGETILYSRAGRDVVEPTPAKAFVHSPSIGSPGSNRTAKEFIGDTCIFSGVTLSFRPKKGDSVTHANKVWTVDEIYGVFEANGGVGILKCVANVIHTTKDRFAR